MKKENKIKKLWEDIRLATFNKTRKTELVVYGYGRRMIFELDIADLTMLNNIASGMDPGRLNRKKYFSLKGRMIGVEYKKGAEPK